LREVSLKATYINLMLLALADGKLKPAEEAYLVRFLRAFGLTRRQAKHWHEEVTSGDVDFQPIEDKGDAEKALGIMAHMVRADGEFVEAEQDAYLAMGKALGFSDDQLGAALRAYWNKDPLGGWATAALKTTDFASVAFVVLVMVDDIPDKTDVARAGGGLRLHFREMGEAFSCQLDPSVVIFHAAKDREDSEGRLATLKRAFPEAFIAFIARQDQAPQIGWLLDHGADRCFVEPLNTNEIAQAIADI
jgi:hypothetical protein